LINTIKVNFYWKTLINKTKIMIYIFWWSLH